MPLSIYLLGLTSFSLGTAEFMIAGMMPSLTRAFGVSVAEIGYLISLYAGGMVIGGPPLTALLLKLRIPNKQALLCLLTVYAAAQAVAASATSYDAMALARLATGISGSACFGTALTIGAALVTPDTRGKSAAVVLGGMMLATVLGVPLATVVDQHMGWRAAFWLVFALTVLCGLAVAVLVPKAKQDQAVSLGVELAEFKSPHLWAAYTTSALIIGATFAAFSYFTPILTEVTGFTTSVIPWLLGFYGLANVLGTILVGHFADRYTMTVMLLGLIVLTIALALLALLARHTVPSVALVIIIGFAGISMNPAMIARVMKTASHPGPLVNTVHSSIINLGLAVGAWAGGLAISRGYGLLSPLWVGVALAILGLLSLIPYLRRGC